MGDLTVLELELIEVYELLGEKRFRFRVKGSKIVINVSAEDLEEARKKAADIALKIRVDRALRG